MRSPWRELGETRTVTVDAHGIWVPACASLAYFSHGANSEVGLRAKATRHSIATTSKYPSSHALPLFPMIVTYKVARRRKSFQFSLAVCLVTGSLNNNLWRRGAFWAKSAEPTHQVSGRMQSGKPVSPTWKNGFRGSLSSHQPICKRKMNACWDARHVCTRIITHTHASTPLN